MATPFDARLAQVVRSGVTDTLKPRGFRKRGVVYRRQLNELQWLIDVQKSGFNSEEKASFTLNWGVFVPGVGALYWNSPDPTEPQVPQCCIYGRVGRLTPARRDLWWDFRPDDPIPASDEQIAHDLRRCLLDCALPFLEQFQTRQDIVEYLELPEKQRLLIWPPSESVRLIYLAILHHLNGHQDRCCEKVAEAQVQAANKPNQEHIAAVAERLCPT